MNLPPIQPDPQYVMSEQSDLTLLDYFAAKGAPAFWLERMLKHRREVDHARTLADRDCMRRDRNDEVLLAELQYDYAAAMLAERERRMK